MRTQPEMTGSIRSENGIDDLDNKLFLLEEEFKALRQILQDVLERLERLEDQP